MLSERFGFQDIGWMQEPDEKTCYAEVEDYFGNLLKMVRWGKFTVLGHMALPLRYMNDYRGFHISLDGYGAELEEILRTLIQGGRGIEVNTNRGGRFLPDARWLRLYRSLGGELITLGSDAHRPTDVGKGRGRPCCGSAASPAFAPLKSSGPSGTPCKGCLANFYNCV